MEAGSDIGGSGMEVEDKVESSESGEEENHCHLCMEDEVKSTTHAPRLLYDSHHHRKKHGGSGTNLKPTSTYLTYRLTNGSSSSAMNAIEPSISNASD